MTALAALLGFVSLSGCPTEELPPGPAPATDYVIGHESAHWWMSLVHTSPTERWAVGGTPAAGEIMRDSGDGFTAVTVGSTVPLLNWIQRFDDSTFVVVGNDGTILTGTAPTSDTANAADVTWTPTASGTDQDLWGTWGASSNDVWAVGGNADGTGSPTILRNTGSGFVAVAVPVLQRPGVEALFKVWGTGADNVYIVGQAGVVLHWNGSELTELLVGANVDLVSVWGTGPDRIAIAGGRANGVVALWDGQSWRTLKLAPLLGFNGVWMRDNMVHLVGAFGTAARLDFTTGAVEDYKLETNVDLHAVHGSAEGKLSCSGGNFIAANGPYQGIIASRALVTGE